MTKPKFHYNPKTCQYDQAKLGWLDVVWYTLGVSMMAALMLAGMVVLYNRFVETEAEIALRNENQAIEKHAILLTSRLAEAEGFLTQISEKDHELGTRLFESVNDAANNTDDATTSNNILTADAQGFVENLNALKSRSDEIARKSSATNNFFQAHGGIQKKDLAIIPSIPTLLPVKDITADKLSSGFGLRINPFHKGLYRHQGVDLVSPRGTEVIATAAGVVSEVRRSDVQAGYGNYIEIDHGKGIITHYSHLQDIHVRQGQRIAKGFAIGTVGNSGGSVAPHVHYEVIKHGKNIDPVTFMIEGLSSDDHQLIKARSARQNQSLD